jgi:hypothetical protein
VGIEQTPQTTWNQQIELLAYEHDPRSLAPGDALTMTLTYRALTDVPADYTAFVHLLGPPRPEDGSPLWAQADSAPCGGALPTGRWRADDIIRDTITLQIPADAPNGAYEIATGFYTWPELARLTVGETGADVVTLGEIQVVRP